MEPGWLSACSGLWALALLVYRVCFLARLSSSKKTVGDSVDLAGNWIRSKRGFPSSVSTEGWGGAQAAAVLTQGEGMLPGTDEPYRYPTFEICERCCREE